MGGKVISITRHTSQPAARACGCGTGGLAHDRTPQVAQLLYRSAMHALLDFLFVLLCHTNPIASSSLR